MGSTRTIIRNKQSAWQKVEDNIIVITSQTRKMHILQGIGGRIWQLLENPIEPDALIQKLQAEYDAPPWQIEEDVQRFLKALQDKSMLEISG